MPNAKNVENLDAIKQDFNEASAMWIVDYRGLTVKEAQQLRRSIREAGAHLSVYKNKLVRIALADLEQPAMDDILSGPSAFVFCGDDCAAAAKVVKEYAKENPKLILKGGLMGGQILNAEQVEAIASLPSRDQLLAQIAGAISGIARGLAVCVNGVPSGLARSIQAVADQKPAA